MMQNNTVDYAKGETPMTDLQFNAFIELQKKYNDLMEEVTKLRQAKPQRGDEGMSDYQFQRYEKMRDKCEELGREVSMLREENAKLMVQAEMLKALTNEKKQPHS